MQHSHGTPVSARTRRARARTQTEAAAPTQSSTRSSERRRTARGAPETVARTAPRRSTVTPPPGAAPAPAPDEALAPAAPAPAPARRRRTRSPPPSQPLTLESPAPPAAKARRRTTRSRAPAEAPAAAPAAAPVEATSLMPASEDLTQPDEAPPPPPVEAPPSVDVPMADARAPPAPPPLPPVRDGLDIVNMLLPRLSRPELIACHQTCRLLRDAVRKASFRPWTKRLALAEQRARRACDADRRLREEFSNAYSGTAQTADHMATHAVPLATLNEVCAALRDFGPERPPAGWWASLPGALAATPETAVWGRSAPDAALVDDLRQAHRVAGHLCETAIGESPASQPWIAAAAFVLNAGDRWRGPMYALAAMEHALDSSTATYTIREFASRLLVALVDGHYPRLKLLNNVPGSGTLFIDVLRALHRLGVAPELRVNRDEPGALTAEQESYAGADLTPRTAGHECLIVEAYAGTGKSHSTLQFAARRQAAGERVLVLYYNQSMYQEMVIKLSVAPGAVCSTMDALVLREFARQAPELVEPGESSMFHDVSAGGPAYSALALRRALRIGESTPYKGTISKHIRKVLDAFVNSADADVPDIEDRRFYPIRKWWRPRLRRGETMPPFQNHARALWRKVISRAPADANLKLSFAEVAKCFQLRALADPHSIDWMRRGLPAGTVLDRITPFAGTRDYNFVVIDEAQDLNPTHYEIFVAGPRRAQQRVAHALVGDPFQSLYAWRGARNALRDAKATLQHTLIRLTKSFRFGGEVADLATAVLQRCSDPQAARPTEVVGAGPPGRIHHRNDIDCHDWRTGTPITVLGRSNKEVLLAAHEYVSEYLAHEDRSPFLFVRGAGGGADMNKTLRLVERLELLRNNGEVGTFGEDTASYEQFVALWREDALDDVDLERAIQMVETTPDAATVVRGIRDMSVETPEEARVVLSTVHQMKGLESGAIRILDDVVNGVAGGGGRPLKMHDSMLCLVYTALSRAIGDLYLPKALSAVWRHQNPPRAVLRGVPPLARRTWCGLCHRGVDPAENAAEDAFGAVPAYDTGATLRVCEFCRGFCDPAVPLQVPTYEKFRAGWDLRAIPDDGSDDDGDAT